MGPARSGLSHAIDRMPDKEQKIVFVRLRELAAEHDLRELSMGTTQDYTIAAEEGATYIRVGSILFADP